VDMKRPEDFSLCPSAQTPLSSFLCLSSEPTILHLETNHCVSIHLFTLRVSYLC
jgi:hypothetical protein